MEEPLSSQPVSTRLRRIAELARERRRVFNSLAHLIDVAMLREAFGHLREKAAPGIDGQSKAAYAEALEENLADLYERLRTQRYRAQPVRRVRIAKESGGERVLSIPALEDKLVQRAAAMLLEAVYEGEFYEGSYGFRPGRSAHQALEALRDQLMELGGVWLVDADIRGYFDHVPHGTLKEVLQRRVNDGGLLRLIGKWLKTGSMEGGRSHHPETGVPQGGVISPILSNIYLHEVLDSWFEKEVRPRLRGRSFLIRFADDFLIGCEREQDARRVLAVLAKRLGKYGLDLHPEKTRLVRFLSPGASRQGDGDGTFEFLGFTHHWGRSRRGHWVVRRRTSSKRLRRAMSSITQWCKRHRHLPLLEQHALLSAKLRGHFGYYGIRDNSRALQHFHHHVLHVWRKWLSRRTRHSRLSWRRFKSWAVVRRLPRPRITPRVVQLSLAG